MSLEWNKERASIGVAVGVAVSAVQAERVSRMEPVREKLILFYYLFFYRMRER